MTQGKISYVDELLDMSEDPVDERPEFSEIVSFFAGTNVLITGCTGFVGKLLVEKLSRCCPDIRTMFLIVRPKKGKSANERCQKLFEDIIFQRLKNECPNFQSKIVIIEGDISHENLGLSDESRKALLSTNVIFHAAATVRFDEKLRMATHANVRATKDMLAFAKEMPNLKAFVYVSTAFSHCVTKYIEEKHYDPPYDPDKLLHLVEILDDEKLDLITEKLIGKWPNTYAFTKAIAENLVRQFSVGIPTCIVRPSMMIPTAAEPFPGWIDNFYGPTGAIVASAVGAMHTLHCKKECVGDIIPGDLVISGIIAASWDTGIRGKNPAVIADSSSSSNISDIDRVPIYNLVSMCQNPIRWGDFMQYNYKHGYLVPTIKAIWFYFLILEPNAKLDYIYRIFFHLIPATIADTVAYLLGRKPVVQKLYKKIHKYSDVVSNFTLNEWKFNNDSTLMLLSKLNAADRKMFDFNMKDLDWDLYFYNHVRGIRVYLIGDPIETVDEGVKKLFRLKIMHYTLLTVLCLLLFWLGRTLFSYFWSWC